MTVGMPINKTVENIRTNKRLIVQNIENETILCKSEINTSMAFP